MKSYILENGFTLVGKGWQVRALLRQYSRQYKTVAELIGAKK